MRCSKGHEINSLYTYQKKPYRSMKTIHGYAYCSECGKILKIGGD